MQLNYLLLVLVMFIFTSNQAIGSCDFSNLGIDQGEKHKLIEFEKKIIRAFEEKDLDFIRSTIDPEFTVVNLKNAKSVKFSSIDKETLEKLIFTKEHTKMLLELQQQAEKSGRWNIWCNYQGVNMAFLWYDFHKGKFRLKSFNLNQTHLKLTKENNDNCSIAKKLSPKTKFDIGSSKFSYEIIEDGAKFNHRLIIHNHTTKYSVNLGGSTWSNDLFQKEKLGDDIKIKGDSLVRENTLNSGDWFTLNDSIGLDSSESKLLIKQTGRVIEYDPSSKQLQTCI